MFNIREVLKELGGKRVVDKRAPKSSITYKEMWIDYVTKNPRLSLSINLTPDTYFNIVSDYNQAILDAMTHQAYSYILGFKLGSLCFEWRDAPINKKIDYNESKKQGVKVYHNNSHSRGKYIYCKWYKNQTINISIYRFALVKDAKRTLAKETKAGKTKIL